MSFHILMLSNRSFSIITLKRLISRSLWNHVHLQQRLPRNHSVRHFSDTTEQEPLREIWTIPNIITISRIASSPLIAIAIASDMKEAALIGCTVGAFSDWLDGYIAKNYNQKVAP
jgi:cardiolipin synthase (CMP-forming)